MNTLVLHKETVAGETIELKAVFNDKDVGALPISSYTVNRKS